MAGLQSGHVGTAAHFMLIARQDAKIDPNMIKIISPKFNTLTFNSRSSLKGWPQGPNGIFGSTMIHIANSFKDKYECVYWLEPDAVPISPNWFSCLVDAWKRRPKTALIVGSRSDCNGNGTGDHITGCAIYHPEIARLMPYLTTCSQVAWDYQHRNRMVLNGSHTNLIQNRYRQTNVDPRVIEEPGVVIIHGVKTKCIVNAVAKKFGIKMH